MFISGSLYRCLFWILLGIVETGEKSKMFKSVHLRKELRAGPWWMSNILLSKYQKFNIMIKQARKKTTHRCVIFGFADSVFIVACTWPTEESTQVASSWSFQSSGADRWQSPMCFSSAQKMLILTMKERMRILLIKIKTSTTLESLNQRIYVSFIPR